MFESQQILHRGGPQTKPCIDKKVLVWSFRGRDSGHWHDFLVCIISFQDCDWVSFHHLDCLQVLHQPLQPLCYNPYFLVQLSSQKRYICSAEEEVKVKRVGWLIVPRESLRFVPYGLSRHMAGTIFGTHSGLARFADPPQ